MKAANRPSLGSGVTQGVWAVSVLALVSLAARTAEVVGKDPVKNRASSGGGSWSRILQPFKTKGLDADMSLLWGLRDEGPTNGAGGHEGGTPMSTTGTDCPGTRSHGGEADDGVAGGPSWDQIILNDVKADAATGAVAMTRPGIGYANAICDARIELLAFLKHRAPGRPFCAKQLGAAGHHRVI